MSRGTDPRQSPLAGPAVDQRDNRGRMVRGEPAIEPLTPARPSAESIHHTRSAPGMQQPREVHEIRGRTYRVRTSETQAMIELGKFRAIAQEDLVEFFYRGDKARFRPDIENVVRQGLVELKSIPHEEKGSRTLLTLTRQGHRFLEDIGAPPKGQALYHGFTKPREAHHDADLYRLYQKQAETIERQGGRNLRVVLDYEMKKRVYHDLAKLGKDRNSSSHKREIAERHQLRMVSGKIPVPDIRIEYETREGEKARKDLELATNHYRKRNLAEKARAGFSIYAHGQDASKLRRILDERELTAEILSL